jgi:REP element-mobilizing transposase RayT
VFECLSGVGDIVEDCWQGIPLHYPNITLDEFIIMPNHVHGILFINEGDVGAEHAPPVETTPKRGRHASPLQKSRMSLSTVMGSFKAAATKRINQLHNTPGKIIWQRSFYDRIIRDEDDLHNLRGYIHHNAAKWPEEHEEIKNI